MAGMGLDAAVVAATHLKHQIGWMAYAVSGSFHLAIPRATFTIRLDGRRPFHPTSPGAWIAGNSGLLPGGWSLLPAARVDDGFLDIGILAPARARGAGRGWPPGS